MPFGGWYRLPCIVIRHHDNANFHVHFFLLLYSNWELYFCIVFVWMVTRNHINPDICAVNLWTEKGKHDLLGNGLDGNSNYIFAG